jgi:hypothetical protein
LILGTSFQLFRSIAFCRKVSLYEDRMEILRSNRHEPTELETLGWNIEPLNHDYRYLPIEESFSWPKLLTEVRDLRGIDQSQYYLVSFRSTRLEGDDIARKIEELDTAAFQEAKKSPALLHYFGGCADGEGRAMSWCLWTDAPSAHEALTGTAHKEAAHAAMELYEAYEVDCFDVYPNDDQGIVFNKITRHSI